MSRARSLRVASILVAALAGAAAADPVLFVGGDALESGDVPALLPLPDGGIVASTEIVLAYRLRGAGPGGVYAWDLATGEFLDDGMRFLGPAAPDRFPGDYEWYAFENGAFAPLGVRPAELSPSGAPLLAVASAPAARDTDGDGVPDAVDVCTLVPDGPLQPPTQRDSNADGFGNRCDADLDGSGIVNFGDLAILKRVFFSRDADADLNGDGLVNFSDLQILKAGFLQPPGPSGAHP